MTAYKDRPLWWLGLRGFVLFLVGGGLGVFAYTMVSQRPDPMPWGGVLFGGVVCGTLSALFAKRRRS
ncbi:hypothetical protein ACIRP3_41940 [Streptomyces sp. NPDC101209]|uniref:hypothetical protein n=1 Tax=Streptomyces sp. NPDC101209 TaxID=3366129 RepID=UPI003808CCFE